MQTLRKLSLVILGFTSGFTHCAPLLAQNDCPEMQWLASSGPLIDTERTPQKTA